MKKKLYLFILFTLLCSSNCIQCMNLTSSLQTLNIKLQQLTKQLRPITEISVGVDEIFNKLQSSIKTMQNNANELDTHIKNLFAMRLEDVQLDFPFGDPLNEVAEQASNKARAAQEKYQTWNKALEHSFVVLSKIGGLFKKGKLQAEHKQQFISILFELQKHKNKLQEISEMLKKQDLNRIGELKLHASEQERARGFFDPAISVKNFIYSSTVRFGVVSTILDIIVPRITALIQTGNKQLIRNDISIIKKQQKRLQEVYDKGSTVFDEAKKLSSKSKEPIDQDKLSIIINKFEAIVISLQQPFSDLEATLEGIKIYGSFITDTNLKSQLLSTVKRQNFYQELIEVWEQRKEELFDFVPPMPMALLPIIDQILMPLIWLKDSVDKVFRKFEQE